MQQIKVILYIFSVGLISFSCNRKNFLQAEEYQFKSPDGKPHYNQLNYWAAHPWKKDPSDSIPGPLRAAYQNDSLADVFFIHPTSLTKMGDPRMNARIDDGKLNAHTDYTTILYQASAFNRQCRVFAPRYRQAHIRAFYMQDSISKPYFDLAYEDIKIAFQYYLSYFNHGRPFIIASHSQGTVHASRLIREMIENTPLQKQLVCAYLVGMAIPENFYSGLSPCKDENATGCFVSWRTFKKGYIENRFIAKEKFKAVVTNPLLWTAVKDHANRSLNKGAILKNFNKLNKRVVDAEIHGNVLWTCKPHFFGNFLLRTKNYHIGDINLFYINIEDNITRRLSAFLKHE